MVIQIKPEKAPEEEKTIQIFLQASDVHTDIVIPARNKFVAWESIVSANHSLSPPAELKYISFGWGDLDFYKNTPQWDDLTPKTAIKSLFFNTPSALHVKFLNQIPTAKKTIPFNITPEQYKKLSGFILNSFKTDEKGNAIPISSLHYTNNDAFYYGNGSLNLFRTCNTWTNNALKTSGLPACLWTPLTQGILYTYR